MIQIWFLDGGNLKSLKPEAYLEPQSEKNIMAPFYGYGATLNAAKSLQGDVFNLEVSRSSWYLSNRPLKDERMSQPWNHLVISNLEPQD